MRPGIHHISGIFAIFDMLKAWDLGVFTGNGPPAAYALTFIAACNALLCFLTRPRINP